MGGYNPKRYILHHSHPWDKLYLKLTKCCCCLQGKITNNIGCCTLTLFNSSPPFSFDLQVQGGNWTSKCYFKMSNQKNEIVICFWMTIYYC